MVKTTAEWVYCDKNWDKNKLCGILFCVCFDPKAIFIQIQFQNHYFCWKNTIYGKEGVTVWVSDLVLDLSGRANVWKCSCLPVHLENRPLKIIANGAVWSSLIFYAIFLVTIKIRTQDSKVSLVGIKILICLLIILLRKIFSSTSFLTFLWSLNF